MKTATTILKKQQKVLLYCFVTSLVLGMIVLFIGGLSYANPKLEFAALFKLEPLQNLIYTIIPKIQ